MDFTVAICTTIIDIHYRPIVVYFVTRHVHRVHHTKNVPLVTVANMALIVNRAVQLVVKITPVISIPGRVNVHSIFKVIIVIAA
jgi:hypothetical protein